MLPTGPRSLSTLSLWAFGAWLVPLVLLLSLEHVRPFAALFSSRAATYAYLTVHGLLTLLALVLGILTLVRGPARSRLIVSIPVLILLLYAAMLLAGPG